MKTCWCSSAPLFFCWTSSSSHLISGLYSVWLPVQRSPPMTWHIEQAKTLHNASCSQFCIGVPPSQILIVCPMFFRSSPVSFCLPTSRSAHTRLVWGEIWGEVDLTDGLLPQGYFGALHPCSTLFREESSSQQPSGHTCPGPIEMWGVFVSEGPPLAQLV